MSETTKRIEEIAKELFEVNYTGTGTFLNLPKDSLTRIKFINLATHLHEEVIRGRIDELKSIVWCYHDESAKDVEKMISVIDERIGELERQIDNAKGEGNE